MSLTDPDWIDPIESTFDPGKAIRSDQGLMMAGNLIALALAKPGAPRIVPAAIDNWLARVELTTATTPVAVTGIDTATMVQCVGSFENGTGDTAGLQMSGSADGGTTWGTWVDLSPGLGQQNTRYPVNVVIDMATGVYTSAHYAHGDLGTGPFDAIRFRHSNTLSGSGNDPARIAVWAIGRTP